MKRFRQRKAFTIVEMVIVIAVIAILATVLVPTISGVIQKANHSADTQFVASLNVQLALWPFEKENGGKEITSEADLRNAINFYYGTEETPDFYATLSPKSAAQGYHYWWDAANKMVVLEKYEKLADPDGDGVSGTDGEGEIIFSAASPRSLLINNMNYFLMDQEGSELVDTVNVFETLSAPQDYENAVNDLKSKATAGSIEEALLAKVQVTTIVNGEGAYRFNDVNAIAHVYIPRTAEIINIQKIYEYNSTSGEVNDGAKPSNSVQLANPSNISVVQIPVGVKIASNGFPAMSGDLLLEDLSNPEKYNNATVLEIMASDMSALTNAEGAFMFDIQTSNPVFKLAGSAQLYVVIEGGVYTLPYNSSDTSVEVGGDLGTGTSGNLDVSVSFPSTTLGEDAFYYDTVNKILYVQYDQTEVPITVKNGGYVTWDYSADGMVSISGNTLSILKEIEIGDNNQITVTGKINDEEKVSFTVCLIMPREVQIGNVNSTLNSDINLVYNGSETEFTFSFAVNHGEGQNSKVNTWPVTPVGTANFDITINDDNTITITPKNGFSFSDVLKIKVGTEEFTFNVTCEDKSGAAFTKAPVKEGSTVLVGDNYLFRVGNKNAIQLNRLFTTTQPYTEVVVKFYDWSTANHPVIGGNVAHSQTVTVTGAEQKTGDTIHWFLSREQWNSNANVSVQFNKTGVVKIEIGHMVDGAFVADRDVLLEVVDGTNVFKYSQLTGTGNFVLWDNIEMPENGTKALSNCVLFGNGYTFDVQKGAWKATTNGYTSEMYVISLNNAVLDNVKIVGKVYTEFNITGKSDYNRAIILSSGNSAIYNSYISNGAAPVRIYTGTLVIDNTTLKGGSFANLDVHGGNITLRDVTTINQVNGNDKADDGTTIPIGLGVAVWYEQVNAETTITIEGTLDQYNFIAENQTSYIKNSYAKAFVNKAFTDSNVAPYRYNDGTNEWVNTGILSMVDTFDADNLKPAKIDGYGDKITVSASGKSGMLCTVETNASNYTSAPTEWKPTEQEEIAPTYTWDWTSKNYVEKTDGSNDYCYHDGSKVQISMDEGDIKNWDVSILTANKLGNHPAYRVFMNGVEYTGGAITFSAAGDYVVEYVITDPLNYDKEGNPYSKEYTKTIEITVSVVKAAAKNATFDFGGNGYDRVTIGNDTYIMPKTGNSITINGTTVRYVLIDCEPSNGKYENSSTSYWNMIYPVFYNVITITDYADGGTGAAVTYGATTTSKPDGLTLAGNSNNGSLPSGAKSFSAETNASAIFKYSSSADASNTPTTFKMDGSNRLVYKSPQLSNNGRSEGWMLVRYQYQDNAGKIYYYVVCYHTPTMIEGSGGCVTPDTLVTLADGTQKEIQYVTYEDHLKVWNFYTGEYEIVPAAIIFNMGTDYFDVLTLKFDDGTTVKTINGHRFFDTTVNSFELISTANVENYIGHEFAKVDGDGYRTVKLVGYSIENEYTTSYSIMSAFHYNFIVEGMFSDTFHKEDAPLFDYFQVGDNMMYDADQLQAEIAEYGLYTYEEFADYLTYEQFVALNVQYMKISVEKGQFTYEGILELINTYLTK